MAFTVDIRGNASHLEKTLNSAKGSITSIGSVASASAASIAALGAAGAAALGAFVVSSSQAAMNIEAMTMQFSTLLGGANAAGKRMEEIIKFAASTPFEIPELVATSKLLQTLGGDLLATGEGLRMVGDAAAISGQPLEEVGRHIGRVFNAVTSGTSAGESVARLQELGLITGEVKRKFEDLAEAQKKGGRASLTGAQAMTLLKSVFRQTEGAMIALSTTTSGKLSNMKDNIGQLQVAFGKGFNDGFRDALDAANNFLPQLQGKFAEVGQIVGSAITESIQGDTEKIVAIGSYVGEIFSEAFKAAMQKLKGEIGNAFVNEAIKMTLDPTGGLQWAINKLEQSGVPLPDYAKIPKFSPFGQSAGDLTRTAMQNLSQSESAKRMDEISIANGIKEGLRKGELTEGMRAEVRQGIMDAWAKDPMAGRAKFSN